MGAADFEASFCTHRPLTIKGGRVIQQITGGKNLTELRERLAPYVSRLRRDQVLDLPPLQLVDFALSVGANSAVEAATTALSPALLETLRQADDEALPGLLRQHAPALASLRRALGTLKAPAAVDRILEHLEAGEDRILAFFHHRDAGALMLEQLRRAGVVCSVVRGDTPAGARTTAIDALADGNLQVLLMQTQVGGLGLNLQACRVALIVEPDWTDVATQQAIGRIYRAGQDRRCTAEFLFVPDSLDEHVTGVARRKAAIATNLIDVPHAERSMKHEHGSPFPAA
jgi:SNF2 family DNA or RNA helicase